MASIKFTLKSKAKKNVTIYTRVSINRKNVFELNTGFTINPEDWSFAPTPTKEEPKKKSQSRGLPKQNTPENKILYGSLNKLNTFIYDNLNKDLDKGISIDKCWVESKIKECFNRVEKTDEGLVINHIQYIIDNANTRKIKGREKLGLSENRIKGYITFKNLFEIYQKHKRKQFNFIDINKTFVDGFINWLINTKKYSTNYAGKQIDNLKTVCLDAEKLDIPTNPYVKHIEGFTEDKKKRLIQTLSFKELELIRNAEITKPELLNARNWLLLGCEIGQRVGDLMSITNENIRYERGNIYIDIVQEKTGKEVTVGIIAPHVIYMIENDLPHKISTQKLNAYIKRVCEIAEINEVVEGSKLNPNTRRKERGLYPKHELITTHIFRRSFATNYYKKVPTAILINITGHSKESLFLTYINESEDKDTNADLFMKFYEDIHKDKTPQLKVVKRALQ